VARATKRLSKELFLRSLLKHRYKSLLGLFTLWNSANPQSEFLWYLRLPVALRQASMAIYQLQNSPMGPEEISRLSDAYDLTLRALSIRDRNDPHPPDLDRCLLAQPAARLHDLYTLG
jgi:hypothetical protein